MIAEVGHFALALALVISIVQSVLPLVGAQRGDRGLMALADYASLSSFLFVAISHLYR